MYDYLIATDEGFKQSLQEKEEEKEEDDEDALFAVSDEDMEDEPVLEVGASRCADD